MLQFLEQKLRDDVEGTCDGRYGYIVKVVAIDQLGDGTVIPGTGLAEFNATYRAIVLKPVSDKRQRKVLFRPSSIIARDSTSRYSYCSSFFCLDIPSEI